MGILRRTFLPLIQHAPWLRSLALNSTDVLARPILAPFRLDRPSAAPYEPGEANIDELNRAAEQYFANYPNPQHLLNKPFSEAQSFSQRLIDAGVLVDGLRLRPGDVVLELGAGTCWLSHFLNRFGCRTIAVDVSPTALALGRQLFANDPQTNWSLAPEFHAYDGHTLPVADASVDSVVLCDAFHHLPNPGALLREMRRVLRPDGIVAMSEPGRGHAESVSSVAEVASTGVLEQELVLEDIADLALKSGFVGSRVVIATRTPPVEIDAHDLRAFMGGAGFSRYWRNLCAELDGHHYLLLFRDDPQPTTRRPRRLKAIMRTNETQPFQIKRGHPATIAIDVRNAGDTTWLSKEAAKGWTRFGAHLYAKGTGHLIDFEWVRVALPRDIQPEETFTLDVNIPAIDQAGECLVVGDFVIEGREWFADRGSPPMRVTLRVTR